jgi:hypothetical protein
MTTSTFKKSRSIFKKGRSKNKTMKKKHINKHKTDLGKGTSFKSIFGFTSSKGIFGSTFSKGRKGRKGRGVDSYTPTINKRLISMHTAPRTKFADCNNNAAFNMREPLQIAVGPETCRSYATNEAKQILLRNLSANKHVDVQSIVPPMQSDSNCWFNTMFAALFISDKGRKFFHFFRQLMIEGRQANGDRIPSELRNAFAILNFAVESALTGSEYAYELNTNNIIHEIYKAIPDKYHAELPYIKDVGDAGNPMRYYSSIINYLNYGMPDANIQLLYINDCGTNWKSKIDSEVEKMPHLPHIIVMEIFDGIGGTSGESGKIRNKPLTFSSNQGRYVLDSCITRDTSRQHFCATITCEKREMAYDGMSFHRLMPLEWKKYINSDFEWQFEGSNNSDGTPLHWNFTHGYQMLLYYRTN